MATVPNKDGGSNYNDRKLTTPTRKNAGSPQGSLTPAFAGEVVLDTTTGQLWYALDLTTTGWATAAVGA